MPEPTSVQERTRATDSAFLLSPHPSTKEGSELILVLASAADLKFWWGALGEQRAIKEMWVVRLCRLRRELAQGTGRGLRASGLKAEASGSQRIVCCLITMMPFTHP